MHPFVSQLASLCKAHVTRNKWVFVPSHAIGRTIGERLTLDGTNWLNLRFVTPLDVAIRMAGPFLVERGIDPSEEGLGPALMMRLLLDASADDNGYFRPLANQPKMAEALWTTIRELRLAGVKADDLKREAFESPAKYGELRELLASYERFLREKNRGDVATVYEEALRHPEWCPIQPQDCWTELPDTVWSSLQRLLIDATRGERIVPRAFSLPGAAIPRRHAARQVERCAPDLSTNPLAFLLSPGESVPPLRKTAKAKPARGRTHNPITLFHAGGHEAEIEEVFRRILAVGAPLDLVEIACGSQEQISLVWEKALRHGWPVTLGPGLPAASTRPGRALLGFCDWIETDFSAGHLRRLLQSGDMDIEPEDEGFTAAQAARTLARAEAGWGRATYDLSLGLLEKAYASRAADPEISNDDRETAVARARVTAEVRRWITKLIASVPEETSGRLPLQAIVNAAISIVDRATARVSALDYKSAATIVVHLTELRALGEFSCSLTDALRFIRERVESLNVAPDRPRPGHLYACRLSSSGFSGRPNLFVVGLEEGMLFPVASEDPVLLDSERSAISAHLRLSSDRIDEAVYSTLDRLASWPASGGRDDSSGRAQACFSYSCRDTREFRETYASWLMLQAFRLERSDSRLSYPDMKAALGEPASVVPQHRADGASEIGWWLKTLVGTGERGAQAAESAFAGIAHGREAERRREEDEFTEFDGFVPAAGALLDPCAPSNSFSVTDLESAAQCPFRFFLKRGLGIRPVDEGEREKDVWLDPLTRGSELHDIYAALLRRCRSEKRRPHLQQDGAWLTRYAQDALDRLNREMPPATAEILDRETKDFLADVELFLEAEVEDASTEPIAFEVSFGRPLGDVEEDLARESPVDIDLGGGLIFRIAGRIDRIDKIGSSEFQVLDYKTGSYWRDDWQGIFGGGRRLQHALYGLAAVELLKRRYKAPSVSKAVYYFSSHKGRRERIEIPAPTQAQIARVLGDLRDVIVGGTFVHAADEGACKFCDYKAACDDGVYERASAKAADAKLVAYGRLAAHV